MPEDDIVILGDAPAPVQGVREVPAPRGWVPIGLTPPASPLPFTSADELDGDEVQEDEFDPIIQAIVDSRPVIPVPKATRSKRVKKEEPIVEVPAPPAPILHQGQEMWSKPGIDYIFCYQNGSYNRMAGFVYHHMDETRVKCAAMMHGETPVFACTQAALDQFKDLLNHVTVTVPQGKSLLFFDGTGYPVHAHIDDQSVVAISKYGDTLMYGSRFDQFGKLKLNDPLAIDDAVLYKETSSFISRATSGARINLQQHKDQVKRIQEEKSEEIYLYVSDFTAPPGKEDTHRLVLERLEKGYEEDSMELRRASALLAEEQEKIKMARSQLPSGKKGIPLRKAYLKSPILKELLDYYELERRGKEVNHKFWFARDLIVEEINYGRPFIEIIMTPNRISGRENSFIRMVIGSSLDKKGFSHPHLNGSTRWCLGTYITPIQNAFLGGNLPLLVSILWQYLSRYNADSPLIRIEDCRQLQSSVQPREIIVRRK